jgi:hypothetical protein
MIQGMTPGVAPGTITALVYLEKLACGRFSDIGFVSAGKKRGFCRLRMGSRGLNIQTYRS